MVGEFDSPAFHQQANDYRSDTLYFKGKVSRNKVLMVVTT